MCDSRKLLTIVWLGLTVILGVVNAQCNEDTISPTCRPTTQMFYADCILPEHPEFGQWILVGRGRNRNFYLPGQTVTTWTHLRIRCNRDRKLDGVKHIFCMNGKWTDKVGTCSNTNSKVTSTSPDDKILFEDQNTRKYNVAPQTTATPEFNHESRLYNGTKIVQGTYPWQVAIYKIRQKELICGGSLVSQRIIVSAAHCVTDPKGHLMSKDLYEVAVGKNYINYDDIRDHNQTQFSSIEDMFTPDNYKGEVQNFVGDIVLILTTEYITFSPKLQPVYLDFSSNLDKNLFKPEKTPYGFVAGWGYTIKNVAPTEDVKKVQVIPVDLNTCFSRFTRDLQIYLTYDKMCSKYFDKNMAVCRGNNGGGFVVQKNGKYYLIGVVSLIAEAPTVVGGCYSQELVLVTRIAEYSDFIQQKVELYNLRNLSINQRANFKH